MKKLLIANFKSNKTIQEANDWLKTFSSEVSRESLNQAEVAVAPTFLSLEEFSQTISEQNLPIQLTTQNISAYPAGSYTGAISVQNLNGLNIQYAIVGHSERRQYFGETSGIVAKKVTQALDGGMVPIVCFDSEYLEEQVNAIDTDLLSKCVFAYEPLSAIGSGNNVDVGTVREVEEEVSRLCGEVRFLYGGSVTAENVSEYLLVTDGVLVGSFSLNPEQFAQLVATATGSVYQRQ